MDKNYIFSRIRRKLDKVDLIEEKLLLKAWENNDKSYKKLKQLIPELGLELIVQN